MPLRFYNSIKRVLSLPHYRYNPRQVLTRLTRAVRPQSAGLQTITLPWGIELRVNRNEFIGGSIWATGVHDLAVSEAICRTLRPGDTAVDAGANIGYMMGIMALRVGKSGRVLCFEPHPGMFESLQHNADLLSSKESAAEPELFRLALSARSGQSELVTDEDWETHQGLAHLDDSAGALEGQTATVVDTRRLDDVVGDTDIALLKLDVEGHEADVLLGASRLLAERRIRTVIYEERGGMRGPSHQILSDAGFTLFYLDSRRKGAFVAPLRTPRITPAPDFLATLVPDEIVGRFSSPGWQLFRGR